jgi:hypothetical protein
MIEETRMESAFPPFLTMAEIDGRQHKAAPSKITFSMAETQSTILMSCGFPHPPFLISLADHWRNRSVHQFPPSLKAPKEKYDGSRLSATFRHRRFP